MEVKEKKGGGGREKRPFVRNDVFGCATDMVLCFDASLESSYDLARQKRLRRPAHDEAGHASYLFQMRKDEDKVFRKQRTIASVQFLASIFMHGAPINFLGR